MLLSALCLTPLSGLRTFVLQLSPGRAVWLESDFPPVAQKAIQELSQMGPSLSPGILLVGLRSEAGTGCE